MNYYGFPGDVSFTPQNRINASYKGCNINLGSVAPLPSGTYFGAPGQRVPTSRSNHMRNNLSDRMVFSRLGIPTTGPSGLVSMAGLGLTDRERCAALATTGAGVTTAIMNAIAASQPGGTEAQREARERLERQFAAAGGGVNAAAALCNLIDSPNPTVNSEDPMNLVRQQLARLEAQQAAQGQLYANQSLNAGTFSSMSTGTKVALGVGAAAILGGAAWFLLKKKR